MDEVTRIVLETFNDLGMSMQALGLDAPGYSVEYSKAGQPHRLMIGRGNPNQDVHEMAKAIVERIDGASIAEVHREYCVIHF